MDGERWNRIQEIFESALEAEDREREQVLRDACGDDADLLEEVRSLLSASGDAEGFLRGMAGRAGLNLTNGEEDQEPDPSRLRFGAYQVTRLLGRGGMGTVYVAERDDEHFHMEVALKVVPGSAMSPEARARFLSERQILARLNHPNIAQLLDGGVSTDGLPYYVMELVDGVRIDEYCRERGLGVRERVEIFLQVCRGVQHAHGNLVVHRDLKPANILVTAEGTVKLLDFGIARMLESEDALYRTALHAPHPMTLAYASPEQVMGEPPTTACDVYGLGVLLYRLLTGRHPYEFEPGSTFPEVQRQICDVTPTRPSAMGTEAPEGDAGVERGAIVGDLDAVTLKAMAKEPERRYATVGDLAADLERYLEGLPVVARTPTLGYRLRRFVGRNRLAVTFGSLVTALALALVVVGVRYTVETRRAAEELALEVQTTQAVSDYLVGLFTAANPEAGGSDTLSARTLLDRGTERVDADLGDAPLVRARVLRTLSDVYRGLGFELISDSLGYAGLLARRDALGYDHPETLVDALVLAQRNIEAQNSLTLERAESLLREVLDVTRDRPDLAQQDMRAERLMGFLRLTEQKPEEALQHLRASVARAEVIYPDGDPEVLTSRSFLARAFRDLEMTDSAIAVFRDVLAGYDALGLGDETAAGSARSSLAILLRRQGRLEEAEAEYRTILDRYESVMTRPDYHMIRRTLAGVLADQGKYGEAVAVLRENLRYVQEHWPPDHWQVGQGHEALGQGLQVAGELEEAEAMMRRGLEIYAAGLGPSHRWTARTRARLGENLAMQGRYEEARAELARAEVDLRAIAAPDDRDLAMVQAMIQDVAARRESGSGASDSA